MQFKQYLNFDLEILSKSEGYWSRVLYSPEGEGSTLFDQNFAVGDLHDCLSLVGGAIRGGPLRGVNNGASESNIAPKIFGKALYEAVFKGEVGEIWRRSLDDAKKRKMGLRLRLRLTNVPELAYLPWEYLYDPRYRRFFCHSNQTPIVRYLELAERDSELAVRLPLRILVVMANPNDLTQQLDVEAEWQKLAADLHELQERKLVVLERIEQATVANLQSRLRQDEPVHVLHFIGHGLFDPQSQTGGLLLVNEQGSSNYISAEQLGTLLGDHPPRLVFLNACEGATTSTDDPIAGTAQHLFLQGIPVVIAMQFAVTDLAATELAQQFYKALTEGAPVDAALAEARKAIYTRGSIMEWGTPVLFMRTPDGYLFDVKELLPTPDCPYPGMTPFAEQDEKKFYGRDDEIAEALELLRLHPFLAVIGASGSGKSSLVFAGLLPALKRSRILGKGAWEVKIMRPGDKPLETLADLLELDPADLDEAMLNLPWLTGDEKCLLIVDQFEELFTLNPPATAAALQQVLLRLQQLPNLYLVLTARADFYPDLLTSPLWAEIKDHRLELKPLDTKGLREAIINPARDVDVQIDPALVERLLNDAASEPGVLPLIQETLVLLWERVKGRFLSLSTYTTLTHGDEQRTGLQVAIARRADVTLAKLSPAGQTLARRLFLRLVQFGEGRADTRRQQTVANLRANGDNVVLFDQVLNHLTDSRLLTRSGSETSPEARRVDIAHEALINGWPKLRTWISERRTAEMARRELERQAQRWVELGRGEGGLLDRSELPEAEKWLKAPDASELGWSEELAALVMHSRQTLDAADQAVEAARQHELDQAHQLAAASEAQRKAETNARREAERREQDQQRATARLAKAARRLQLRLAIIAVLAVLATGIAFYAARQTVDAVSRGTRALTNESRFWTVTALRNLTQDPVVSLNRSLNALPDVDNLRPYVPEAEFALTQAIRANLERRYLAVAEPPLQQPQVAFGPNWVAVGGTALRLVSYDLTQVLTLTQPSEVIEEVQWSAEHGLLVSRTAHKVQVWQEQSVLAEQTFNDRVACVAWRPHSNDLAICRGQTLRLWSIEDNILERVYDHFPGAVEAARWSPDGQWLLAWDSQHTLLRFGSIERQPAPAPFTPTQPQTLTLDSRVDSLDFLDATHLVAWGIGKAPAQWTVEGDLLFRYGSGGDQGYILRPDHQALLTLNSKGGAELWDLTVNQLVTQLCCHAKPILGAAWYGDDKLVTSGQDGTIALWQNSADSDATEEAIHPVTRLHGHQGTNIFGRADVLATHWQDDQHILSAGEDGTLRLWQLFDDQGIPLCQGEDYQGYPKCYDLTQPLGDFAAQVDTARWVDNEHIVTTDIDGNAHCLALTVPGHSCGVWLDSLDEDPVVQWDASGQRLFTYLVDPMPDQRQGGQLVEVATGATITIPGPIASAFWLPTGLLISRPTGDPALIDPATGAVRVALVGQSAVAVATAQSSANQLATADAAGQISLWDLASGQRLSKLQQAPSENPLTTLQWDATGKLLLAVGRQVALWDTTSGRQIWAPSDLNLAQAGLTGLHAALSPDGQWVAVSLGQNFWLFDVRTPNHQHTKAILGLQWVSAATWANQDPYGFFGRLSRLLNGEGWQAPPRLLLLTWSNDGTARLWDQKGQVEILRLAEGDLITSAEVSPDGAHILTASSTGGIESKVRAWQTWLRTPDALLTLGRSRVTRSLLSGQ